VFQHIADVKPYQRVDFRALVQFAEITASASDLALDMTVLSHGYFPPEVGARLGPHATADYTPWSKMIRGWSLDFLRKMRVACSTETLGMVGLNSTGTEVPTI
jgi:hypothetical protein